MPRYPSTASGLVDIGGSVYSALAHRIATHRGEVYPLQVGDTWLEPADGCRMQDLTVEAHPGLHRYAPPRGLAALIQAIVQRSRDRTGVATEPGDVLVTTGATGGLGAVMGAILDPGDEVLVPAPYWPLITGIVRCFRGRPVVLPLLGEVDDPQEVVRQVAAYRTPRTVALYVSSPNNPTGRVLPRSWIEQLVAWARSEGLWIVSDEVYEDYVYRGEHCYCRSLAPEQTFSVHSFSKAFGMAGNRCGYVLGPGAMMGDLCKVSTHAFYSAPTASQHAAARALDGRGDSWVKAVLPQYREIGEWSASRLGLAPPEGSTFLFVDVGSCLDERGLPGFLEDCASHGLFLAPGSSFGPYPTHVRVCYTAAAPEIVRRGIEVLARCLAR